MGCSGFRWQNCGSSKVSIGNTALLPNTFRVLLCRQQCNVRSSHVSWSDLSACQLAVLSGA
jgi:hypothetical protein